MKIIISLLISLLCFFSTQANSYPNTDNREGSIQSVENGLRKGFQIKNNESPGMNILDRMKFHHVPGVSIAVINNGEVEWAKSYNIAVNETITPQTVFQAASISKPVAATIALSLVEKNKINLDQNANNFLKTWKIADNRYTEKEKVTLRRILSHTAGLTVHGFMGYSSSENNLPTLLQILNGEKPANSYPVIVNNIPGTVSSYSGGGYLIMQKMLEEVMQKKFNDFAHDIVFIPLQMNFSSYELLWPNKIGSIAVGHLEDGNVMPDDWNMYPESAAAGLWTTPSDLAKFVVEIQKSFSGTSNKILSQVLVKQMLTQQPNSNFGLGLVIKPIKNVLEFSHSGSNVGYKCLLLGFTERGQGAVIMTNSDNGWMIISEIVRAMGDTYHWPNGYSEQYKIVEPVSIDANIYKNYVGQYEINFGESIPPLKLSLSSENNKLFITLPYPRPNSEHKTFELTPESERMFFTTDGDFEIIFSPENNNEFTLMGMKARRTAEG